MCIRDRAIFPDAVAVAPQYSSNATLTYGSSDGSYSVVGTTANYATVRNLEIAAGAFFDASQVTGFYGVDDPGPVLRRAAA